MSSRNPLNASLTNEQMFRSYLTDIEPLTHKSIDE
jgi:hypothetical protein